VAAWKEFAAESLKLPSLCKTSRIGMPEDS
jgi:hypothetical protein